MKTLPKILVLSAMFLNFFIFANPAIAEDIKLSKNGDVYTIPIRLNDSLTMSFILDTGAADLGFTDDVINRLISSGVIQNSDFKGSATYELADGSKIKCRKLTLRKVHIGKSEVKNVEASTCPGKDSLLLGQSVLKKLGMWSMDYSKNVLVVKGGGEVVSEEPMYTKKDIAWYEEAGSQNDSNAFNNLALAYSQGNGVSKDVRKAAELWRKSADLGDQWGQLNLGVLYRDGNGVPHDFKKAAEWYEKSAAQGNALAQNDLGVLYANAEGVPLDYVKAKYLFEKAAAQRHDKAYCNLGAMYYLGRGVPQDYVKAAELFQKAVVNGDAKSEQFLGEAYEKGNGVPQSYTMAAEWYRNSAEQGYSVAQNALGWFYHEGWGVPKDDAKAVEWISKAAAQGLPKAQSNLGWMYENGVGLPKDMKKAMELYKKAAAKNDAYGLDSLKRLSGGKGR